MQVDGPTTTLIPAKAGTLTAKRTAEITAADKTLGDMVRPPFRSWCLIGPEQNGLPAHYSREAMSRATRTKLTSLTYAESLRAGFRRGRAKDASPLGEIRASIRARENFGRRN